MEYILTEKLTTDTTAMRGTSDHSQSTQAFEKYKICIITETCPWFAWCINAHLPLCTWVLLTNQTNPLQLCYNLYMVVSWLIEICAIRTWKSPSLNLFFARYMLAFACKYVCTYIQWSLKIVTPCSNRPWASLQIPSGIV